MPGQPAVFFVFFGLQTSSALLLPVAGVAAALAAVGLITKLATGYLAAARAGLNVPERIRAGAALIARGEFTIVIAGLAAAAGIYSHLGPLAAAYVFILAVAGPLAARGGEPLGNWAACRRTQLRERARNGEYAGLPCGVHPALADNPTDSAKRTADLQARPRDSHAVSR